MSRELTAKQKKALQLVQRALLGEMTVEEALRQAGYSEQTAKQQKSVMDSLRNNSVMQEALRKEKVTEERIAKRINKGIDSTSDKTALGFTKLAAELIDAFPAEKLITADVGIEALLDEQEAKTDHSGFEEPSSRP
jgi:phage terminase small subunit